MRSRFHFSGRAPTLSIFARSVFASSIFALSLLVPVRAGARELAPLPPDQAAVFHAPGDEEIEPVDKHYPRSNEYRHDLLFPALKDLGGGYVGVGSDQNYTMMAVAKSELAWLLDHDPIVRDLHQVYAPLIIASDTPDAFIARFASDGREQARKILHDAYTDEKLQSKVLHRFDNYAPGQHSYFVRQRDARFEGKPLNWLGDAELYRWVRAMFRTNRVHAIAADLTGPKAMGEIASAAKKLGAPIRVLYLSNAEDFYPFKASVANVTALPRDARSLVVRTVMMYWMPKAEGCDWHYQTQPLDDYVAKMADPKLYPNHRRMVADLRAVPAEQYVDRAGYSRIPPNLPRWDGKDHWRMPDSVTKRHAPEDPSKN